MTKAIDLNEVRELLLEVPILERFKRFNDILKGKKFSLEKMSLKPYEVVGAPLDPKTLIPGLVLQRIDGSVDHDLVRILRFIHENFSSCYNPTAGVLGVVEDSGQKQIFTVLSIGSNTIMDIPQSGEYYIREVNVTTQVKFEESERLVPYIPDISRCPRKKFLGATTGRLYRLCRYICKQATHTERMALLMAGLAEVVNDPNSTDEVYQVRGIPYRGDGELTLFFHGHWWFCEDCTRAMAEAGVKRIIVLDPHKFK